MFRKNSLKWVPCLIGASFTFLVIFFLYLSPQPVQNAATFLENGAYDFQIKRSYKPIDKQTSPIVIVDIDDASIAVEGQWPWPRYKLATLASKLFQAEAKVVAFDITFPESQPNITEEISKNLDPSSPLYHELTELKDTYNYDAAFAKSLEQGNCVLGFAFNKTTEKSVGQLPPPFLTPSQEVKDQLSIPQMNVYLANIPLLQEAAKHGGFINSSPDPDGVIRRSPLLLAYDQALYASLALEAASLYLGTQEKRLLFKSYGNQMVLEGVELDKRRIATDPYGRILVPFRGPPYSIPYFSAAEILKGNFPLEHIKGKLVFIGSSATAMGDIVATAIAPIYAGVEIHADIAAGILEPYLPAEPGWVKGLSIFFILSLGLLFSLALPFLSPITGTLFACLVGALLLGGSHWLWASLEIVFPVMFPLVTLFFLYLFNMVWGYLLERKKKQEVLVIFGEYVSPDFIKKMMKEGGDFGLQGELKELTVLFADIRNFTSISEAMSASELKEFLNEYFTAMTEVIFKYKGTIDKYVGDMVMAFWGAPLDDFQNAEDAVQAGLEMQKALFRLNQRFLQEKKPEIHIGIGINTGQMNVGDMGSKYRRAYTVIGDAVNLASRLEGACKYYHAQVIVGEETFQKTEHLITYRKLDRVRVKGKGKAIDIYEPLGLTEQCPPDTKENYKKHNLAIEAYFHQNWEEAEHLFQQLCTGDPQSKDLYQIYLDRIASFRKNPPGPHWDSVFVFDTK